jgi:hypothetical protein
MDLAMMREEIFFRKQEQFEGQERTLFESKEISRVVHLGQSMKRFGLEFVKK